MTIRLPLSVCSALLVLLSQAYAGVNSRTLGFASRRADNVESQRFDKTMWSTSESNSLMKQSFPIKNWDKHFSSVGGKRAPLSVSENQEKEIFRTNTVERKEFGTEMSRWNEQVADMHKKAGIKMDDRARLVADQQLYYMMLQDAKPYHDMGVELSLRDLNRFQFRRNRTADGVPVERAGSGE
jgi:hypothetical protein